MTKTMFMAGLLLALVSCATTAVPAGGADERELLRLHQVVLDAHLRSDVELLLRDEEESYTVANRGSISTPSSAERRERVGSYLAATKFSVYRDVVPPIAKVSDDGSLGWVVAQVEGRGEQRTGSGAPESLEFVSAWIELYEKRHGRWVRIGNVSNFKEGE